MFRFKTGSVFVCLLLLLISAIAVLFELRYGRGQKNVEEKNIISSEIPVGSMLLPLIAPLGFIARKTGDLFGDGWKADDDLDDQDKRHHRPPFPFFIFWEIDMVLDTVLSRVEEEISIYAAENVYPFADTKDAIENDVVLANIEFRGRFETKQVSCSYLKSSICLKI